MGLGKTFTGSEAMKRFGNSVNLVICQCSKVGDWVDHFEEFYDCRIYNLTKKKSLVNFINDPINPLVPSIGVINYELAWRRKDLLQLQDFTLMLDESSLIQNPKAKQTKFILKMNPANVILLSGTPDGGKYENLWTQAHLLGWGISESLFNRQYINWTLTEDNGSGIRHKIVDKANPYKNVDRLKRKLREHGALFLKTEEVVDLPEQIIQEIRVDCTSDYMKFKKNSFIRLKDGTELVGDTTLTKRMYSRQLASQYNPNKIQAFKDLLESTNDRLIVFYNFNEELNIIKGICQELGRPISEVNGHCKDLTAYNNESNSVTLCQYKAASRGGNYQKCNKNIYFSLPESSDLFEQSKKRIHRIGQNKTCFYYILIAMNTVDGYILRTLEERKDFTDALFEELHG